MNDTFIGINVRMSGSCINRYRPTIIGRLLDANYRPADNRPLPYRCISNIYVAVSHLVAQTIFLCDRQYSTYGCRAFYYAGLTVWNLLPYELRNSDSFVGFKRFLKTIQPLLA